MVLETVYILAIIAIMFISIIAAMIFAGFLIIYINKLKTYVSVHRPSERKHFDYSYSGLSFKKDNILPLGIWKYIYSKKIEKDSKILSYKKRIKQCTKLFFLCIVIFVVLWILLFVTSA